jgi:UDP-N-acetyl-D-mannosaminuronic acid dehydrogenase
VKPSFGSVSVVGLGYIGLPTAAVLAHRGVDVIGVDINAQAVETINGGRIHIVEPELDVMVRGAVAAGRLRAVTAPEPADAFIIAVPTPLDPNHTPDLSCVRSAAEAIAPVLRPGNLVILESTSPVGTTERLAQWLADARPDLRFPHQAGTDADIQISYCPERVLPGHVLRELTDNDRIIGGMTPRCADRTEELYRVFVRGRCVITDTRTAEMVKLTENAFRDVNIAFANEISLICESLRINVWELIELANLHPRVTILQPGPGVGGHCIAVDPWFIVDSAPELARLITTARLVNDEKPRFVVAKVLDKARRFKSPVIACFGLAFKADIDDLRESPAVEIVRELASTSDAAILAVEPHIDELPPELAGYANVRLSEPEAALHDADIVVLLVNHRAFGRVDERLLAEKIVIDTRGSWSYRGKGR